MVVVVVLQVDLIVRCLVVAEKSVIEAAVVRLFQNRVDTVGLSKTLEMRYKLEEFCVVHVIEPRSARNCVVWVEYVRGWRIV